MTRIDAWDVQSPRSIKALQLSCDLPQSKSLEDRGYVLGHVELGKGGFGSVFVVKNAAGESFACKKITKSIIGGNLQAQQRHLDNIKREIGVMKKLGGTLNTIHLFDAFEDDESVYLVMEHCRGGELFQDLGRKHYSEGTVKSYMRAVLRTIAQCHHHGIIHRDIKPSNFLLLTEAEDSPIKAIDFGLAIFFEDSELPITNLGLEGTPWFMAPELLNSRAGPSIDVFAAGVMCYQLITGTMPFNDWKNSKSPALSSVWKSILTEEPKMTGSIWADVSDEAKEFVKALLVKDPKKRLTAKEALQHPWLQGKKAQRSEGKQLATRVVQRLQRYAAGNAFKKTALELMTNELIQRHEERMTAAETGLAQGQAQSLAQKVSKSASPVSSQDTLSQALEGSQSGRGRARGEKRLIAQDLLMSKSVHGGSLFRFTPVKPPHPLPPPLALPVISPADQSLLASSPDMRTLAEKVAAVSSPPNIASPHSSVHLSCPGRNDSTSNLQSYSLLLGAAQNLTQEVKNGLGGKIKSRERVSSMLSLLDFVDSKKSEHGKVRRLMLDTSARGGTAALSSLMEEGSNGTPRSPLAQTSVTLPANQRPGLGPSTPQRMLESLEFLLPETTVAELKSLLSQGASSDTLSFEQISEALSSLGYNLGPGEVEVLLREVSGSNETTECQSRAVSRNQFIASQVDWRDLQINHRDEWLASLRRTFEEMDTDKDGVLDKDELTSMLANRLPSEAAVNDAVNELLLDVACSDGVDFNDFVRMMREDSRSSMGSLDLYDARHEGGPPHNRYVNNAGGHLEAIESDDEEFEDDS